MNASAYLSVGIICGFSHLLLGQSPTTFQRTIPSREDRQAVAQRQNLESQRLIEQLKLRRQQEIQRQQEAIARTRAEAARMNERNSERSQRQQEVTQASIAEAKRLNEANAASRDRYFKPQPANGNLVQRQEVSREPVYKHKLVGDKYVPVLEGYDVTIRYVYDNGRTTYQSERISAH